MIERKIVRDFFEKDMLCELLSHRAMSRTTLFSRWETYCARNGTPMPKNQYDDNDAAEIAKNSLYLGILRAVKEYCKCYMNEYAAEEELDYEQIYILNFFVDPCDSEQWQKFLDAIYSE